MVVLRVVYHRAGHEAWDIKKFTKDVRKRVRDFGRTHRAGSRLNGTGSSLPMLSLLDERRYHILDI